MSYNHYKYVENNKKTYQEGMKVVLDADMNDNSPNAPKAGATGVVQYVDDMGTVHVFWDNGSSLGLIPDEDSFHVVGGV